jgi:AcrR family transcriptional regulator
MFAEQGPSSVTIRHLAGALGVSPMTPYRYFKDKDAILAAVRARAFNRHAAALEAAYDAHKSSAPQARTKAVSDAYVRFALENPEAYKLMFDIHQPDAGAYPELIAAGARSRAIMSRHVHDLTEAGLISGDPDVVSHLYWAALHGPLMLVLSGMMGPDVDARTLIDGLVSAVTQANAVKA